MTKPVSYLADSYMVTNGWLGQLKILLAWSITAGTVGRLTPVPQG